MATVDQTLPGGLGSTRKDHSGSAMIALAIEPVHMDYSRSRTQLAGIYKYVVPNPVRRTQYRYLDAPVSPDMVHTMEVIHALPVRTSVSSSRSRLHV